MTTESAKAVDNVNSLSSRTGIAPQLAPHAAVALLTVAAAATHAAGELTGETQTVTLWVAATAVVLAVVVATVAGKRIGCRKMRSRLYAVLAVAAGWLTTITAIGVSMDAVAILAALVYAISLHWWRVKRIGNQAAVPTRPVAAGEDRFTGRWAAWLGGQGCVLQGSRLTGAETVEAGVRYVLRLVPGKQTLDGVRAATAAIRTGLELLPREDFIVEAHPDLPASQLLLTVITSSPVADSVPWPGPSAFDAGRVALGPHVDGQGTAAWRVYTNDSLWGGYIAGSSGSGKSRLVESLAMAIAASQSHPTVIMHIDGDEGASSPLLMRHATAVAIDPELTQAQAMLAGALLLMQLRRAENVAQSLRGFTPTADRPGVLIFIDECHLIFADDKCREMAAEIARRGRKVGVNIVAASQVATMDAFGGAGKNGAEVLRSSLRAGNGVMLRSTTRNTKTVFGGGIDPEQFPDLPGYGYYVAASGSGARTAPMRAYYVADDVYEWWPAQLHWRSLAGAEATAWGKGQGPRNLVNNVNEVSTCRAETVHVAQFPTWTPPVVPARPALTDSQQAVLAAITAGATRPSEIRDAVGLSESQVHNLLGELRDARHIDKAGYGKYVVLAA